MIEQQARVVRVDGGYAWVRVGGQSGCAACDAGKGCGAGIFGRLLRRKPVEISLPNGIRAEAGQAVTLALPESLFLGLVMRLYGWPLLAGLAGALICHHIGDIYQARPGVTDLLTLAGMIGGALMVALLARRKGDPGVSGVRVSLLAGGSQVDCGNAALQGP